ncbi:MAG TPA: hypothetical protein VMO88_07485 [Acidimicrobiales bacterium]|nr:hypothetical protein [Acidimicrobiales bacterium]
MARRTWWLVPLALLLTACGGPMAVSKATLPTEHVPSAAVANHRVVKDIVLDGGAFTANSPGDAKARYSLSRAEKLVLAASTAVHETGSPALVALGRVTLSLKRQGGLPSYRDRLAWIGVMSSNQSVSCAPSPPGSGSVRVLYAPYFFVVLLDAQTGKDVVDYRTRGTPNCGGEVTGPRVLRADELLSVPWTAEGEQLGYTIPACARLYMQGGYGWGPETMFIDVEGPIDPPPHCSPARTVAWTSPAGSEMAHAPTGLTSGVVENGALVRF